MMRSFTPPWIKRDTFKKFVARIFGRYGKSRRAGVVLDAKKYGLRRELVSAGSLRTVETLQQRGYHAFIVGGAVRDLLAGEPPKDFDVATDATPEEVRQCFRRSRIIGRRFQIVHVMMGHETVEVTTFRGNHASGAKASTDSHGRLLRDNVFGSHKEDAARRDFTINALYFDPVAETIVDYHDGVADLEAKRLRTIGDAATRYREDPVRMLRAVRLAAKLGFSIDPAARNPFRALAPLIGNVPSARLIDEVLKLLMSGHALDALESLRSEGLHKALLPLLDAVLDDPRGERFIHAALRNADERIRERKTISPAFLFGALLWHEVLVQWEALKNEGEASFPALFQAMNSVLDRQAGKLAITRRVVGDIRDIWSIQPRFEQRSGKRPYALLERPRFRAAYDFMLLRVESGDLPAEIGNWWTDFIDADGVRRAELLASPETSDRPRRRRRRRHGRAPSDSTGVTGGSDGADARD
jgi:poly(A) polymerase